MILGVGSFAHSIGAALADAGAKVSTYLTRNYGHFPPSLAGPTFSRNAFPSPVPLLKKTALRSSSRSPLTGRCNRGRRI